MDEAALARRASIIEALYDCAVTGSGPEWEEDMAALVEQGAVIRDGDAYILSDTALAAMDFGMRAAAMCVAAGADPKTDMQASHRAAEVFGHLAYQLYEFAKSAHRAAGTWIAQIEAHPALLPAMRAAFEEGEKRRPKLPINQETNT